MKTTTRNWGFEHYLALIAVASLVLGAGFQAVTGSGRFLPGFVAASLLIFIAGFLMLLTWHWAGAGKALAWMMVLAFVLRLVLSAFLIWALPRFGYDESPQRAGFVFEDAYRREVNAWTLAHSDELLKNAFSDEYGTDQYGGMLAMSALVYRVLSPDAFRPGLIAILSAAAMTLSIPILMVTIRWRFSERTAKWAGWILALYPEGLLLGASQMREPFFILMICILFWAAAQWLDRARLKVALPIFVVNALIFMLFSYRVAIPSLGAIFIWVWVVEAGNLEKTWQRIVGWVVVCLLGLGSLAFFKPWLNEVFLWDAHLALEQSGVLQFLLEKLPNWQQLTFLIGYGIFQPVLPAAIAVPAPMVWKSIGIFRSVGWYMMLPLLIFAIYRIWKTESSVRQRWLSVFLVVVWLWILIASVRAGGDQWDNPRYRTIFLPWMALLGGWVLQYVLKHKDRWFVRGLIIEGVFLAFFTEWYISRYISTVPRLNFPVMVILILVISLGVLIGGWLLDLRKKHSNKL